MGDLNPALLPWIDALAEQLVADYLTPEAAQAVAGSDARTERVPLPAMDKAA